LNFGQAKLGQFLGIWWWNLDSLVCFEGLINEPMDGPPSTCIKECDILILNRNSMVPKVVATSIFMNFSNSRIKAFNIDS